MKRIGRHRPKVRGLWICGGGVATMLLGQGVVWWMLPARGKEASQDWVVA